MTTQHTHTPPTCEPEQMHNCIRSHRTHRPRSHSLPISWKNIWIQTFSFFFSLTNLILLVSFACQDIASQVLQENVPGHVVWMIPSRVWQVQICWNALLPRQNSGPGHPMTSHRHRSSQTSHNKYVSVGTLPLIWRIKDEICLFFPLLAFSLFFTTFSYISLSLPTEQVY